MRKNLNFAVVILLSCLFFTTGIRQCAVAEVTSPRITWADGVASGIEYFLKKNHESALWRTDAVRGRYLYKLTHEYLTHIVESSYDASRFNNSWGPRRLATIKLLVAAYGESRYDGLAVNVNRNGSVDLGILQINSCHWFGVKDGAEWARFCKMEGIDPNNTRLLLNVYYNINYAGWLNEQFIQGRHATYHYYDAKSKRALYDALLKVTGLKKVALKYDDNEYTPDTPFVPTEYFTIPDVATPTPLMTPSFIQKVFGFK